MNTTKIKGIIWDLGGVLFSDGTKVFCMSHFPNEIKKVYGFLNGPYGDKYREGKITCIDLFEILRELVILNNSDEYFCSEWSKSYIINATIENIILRINNIGLKNYYLSDTSKERVDFLNEKYKFKNLFHSGVFSFEVGARKPARIIYTDIITITKFRPNELIYIDDKKLFVHAAEKMGMHGITYTNEKELMDELSRFGINIYSQHHE